MTALSYAQMTTLRTIARTGRITPQQSKSIQVLLKRGLVAWSGSSLVLTEAGERKIA